ncbi:MAG: M20/M25/M40 family metallo-hydrolase [Ferruginibacter sp.]
MSKILSLGVFIIAIFFVFLSIRSAAPPALATGEVPDTCFSVARAFSHLTKISNVPHSTGTAENAAVREYIISTCRQLGFTVETQSTTSVMADKRHMYAADVNNIIAYKKGLHNSKAVMLMAHHDSRPNTPGAGDDGAGVVSMLETARALQKTGQLQNDLILLFTDGEEIGLFGANAFIKESPLLKEVGLVINFEGRGNAGPSNMFEVNDHNGWVINEYAKSAAHPYANSLGYEIYKKLPNYTDYTLFKDAGITGLNNAFIDGFVNYHSPNDKPENLDQRSLQHHGDNMLSLAKHFGNLSINNTKAPNASYFNLGDWLLQYPASWNLFFVIITDMAFILMLVLAFKNNKINIGTFSISVVLFPVVMAVIYFLSKFLLKFILSRYPLYSHFSENNSYNSAWYFLAMSALAVTIFSIVYYFAARKLNLHSLFAGILFIALILLNVMQYAVPSASYLLMIPLICLLAARFFVIGTNKNEVLSTRHNIINLLSVVPAIWLLVPIVNATFIAFALGSNMPFVVIAVALCAGLLLPVMYPVFKQQKLLVPMAALVCFIAAMLGGHYSSGYTAKKPLQSSVRYWLDADSSKAKWISEFSSRDKWSAGFFNDADHHPVKPGRGLLINSAPLLTLAPYSAVVIKDSLDKGNRKLTVHFNSARENVNFVDIAIGGSGIVNNAIINGKGIPPNGGDGIVGIHQINYLGVNSKGFDVLFEMEGAAKLDFMVSDKSNGLPTISGFDTRYPADIIPAAGSNSNTTQVAKHYIF